MYRKSSRILALIGVALLVLLYLFTLIVALFDFPYKSSLFQACLVATIGVPILIWIYVWIFGKVTGKATITDAPEIKSNETTTESSSEID